MNLVFIRFGLFKDVRYYVLIDNLFVKVVNDNGVRSVKIVNVELIYEFYIENVFVSSNFGSFVVVFVGEGVDVVSFE